MRSAFALILVSALAARAEPLADVLSRMDQAAGEFRSLSAKTRRVHFTAVLSETNEMEGLLRLRKVKGATNGIVEFLQPEARTFFVSGKTAQIFYPNANTVEIYEMGKVFANVDQFLLLGFGTSSAELRKSYDLKAGGTEKIGGTDTTRIELAPRTADLKKLITKIELWIPEGQSSPLREKVSTPSKDYHQFDFSDIKLNPPLPDSAFELKLPPGVKKIYPQK